MKYFWRLFWLAAFVALLLCSVNVAYKMGGEAGIDACVDSFHKLFKKGQSI